MINKHTPFSIAFLMFYGIICLAVDHSKVDVRWINLAAFLAGVSYLGLHLLSDHITSDEDWSEWDD
jgi:hypothetical protein